MLGIQYWPAGTRLSRILGTNQVPKTPLKNLVWEIPCKNIASIETKPQFIWCDAEESLNLFDLVVT